MNVSSIMEPWCWYLHWMMELMTLHELGVGVGGRNGPGRKQTPSLSIPLGWV